MPGDEVVFARKHHYRIQFNPEGGIEAMKDDPEEKDDDIMSRPLLERAGLQQAPRKLDFDSDIFEEDQANKTVDNSRRGQSRRHEIR